MKTNRRNYLAGKNFPCIYLTYQSNDIQGGDIVIQAALALLRIKVEATLLHETDGGVLWVPGDVHLIRFLRKDIRAKLLHMRTSGAVEEVLGVRPVK